jgi:FAD/FMN-containing dehydrogenase
VAFPRDADDVAAAVAAARDHGVTIVARGAGPSLAGQTVGDGLVLDLSRYMNRILELDADSRTAQVQPGVVQDQLNRVAAAHGLMFGPDTSTSNRATLGGMIGNNSAGSGSVRHGMTIDHVRELDVVLSDASTAHSAPVDDPGAKASAHTLVGRIYGSCRVSRPTTPRPSAPASRRSDGAPVATAWSGLTGQGRSIWPRSWSALRGHSP